MTYVIVRANLETRGPTPMTIMSLEEWVRVLVREKRTSYMPSKWEVVAETDTQEEAEALARLIPKRNEEWINDKK